MDYRITDHAIQELERRRIPLETLDTILSEPQQTLDAPQG
jgi:hypothetical protein